MEKLKVLLLEDEFLVAADLKKKIEQLGFSLIKHVDSGIDAIEFSDKLSPDVVLLDIRVKGGVNGIEAGRKIKQLGIPVIYLTSLESDDTFQLAKDTAPNDFLNKPVDLLRLKRSIELAAKSNENSPSLQSEYSELSTSENLVFFKNKDGRIRVFLKDICHLQADSVYCTVFITDGKIIVTKPLGTVLNQLQKLKGGDRFVQIHRSTGVNIDHVSKISGNILEVNGCKLDISEPYREKVKALFPSI